MAVALSGQKEEQVRRSFPPKFVLHSCWSSTDALDLSCKGAGRTRWKERRGKSMFHQLMAVELIVHDLATCTAFYRDTLGLAVREGESTSNSVSFQIDNVYFLLLEARGAAGLLARGKSSCATGGRRRGCGRRLPNPFDQGCPISATPNGPALGATHGVLCRPGRQSHRD